MTKIYFVRHAEPDKTVTDDRNRPLTAKGHWTSDGQKSN